MTYQLNFAALWPYWPELLAGLWVTVQLTAMATFGGIAIGICGAALRSGRPSLPSRLWGLYVELIRNTPFVVQLFFIVFGLPTLGWKLTAGEAALLAMLINLGGLQHGNYPRGHSGNAERAMGSRARAGADTHANLCARYLASSHAAYLSGAAVVNAAIADDGGPPFTRENARMMNFTDWDIVRNLLLAARWTLLLSLTAFFRWRAGDITVAIGTAKPAPLGGAFYVSLCRCVSGNAAADATVSGLFRPWVVWH